jgi:uncharacterized membrane protein
VLPTVDSRRNFLLTTTPKCSVSSSSCEKRAHPLVTPSRGHWHVSTYQCERVAEKPHSGQLSQLVADDKAAQILQYLGRN